MLQSESIMVSTVRSLFDGRISKEVEVAADLCTMQVLSKMFISNRVYRKYEEVAYMDWWKKKNKRLQ